MLIKDVTLNSPEENILFDEALFMLAERGQQGEVLRFWESDEYFIVLGMTGKPQDDIHLQRARADGVRILRRSSGGGTVLQGQGCLNYTLILSKNNSQIVDLKRSYAYILGKIVNSLRVLGVESAFFPVSDIALTASRRKISGNAQKRGRHFIMHHGTVLIDFDLSLVDRYLTMPKSVPDYRENRSHLDFISNVALDRSQFKRVLAQEFNAISSDDRLNEAEASQLKVLLDTKEILLVKSLFE